MIVRRLNTKDDSRLRTTLIRWAFKLNLLHHSSRSGRSAEFTRGQALTALVELGSDASPAIPELLALTRSPDSGIKAAACHALREIAPDELKRVRHE